MIARPDIDSYFLAIACVVAQRTSCLRKAVGCVLVDGRKRVLSTGYNGVAAGQPHCNEQDLLAPDWAEPQEHFSRACRGAFAASGGTGDACGAIHAEINALIQCRDPQAVATAYLTNEPCGGCTKALLASSVERIVFLRPHGSSGLEHWLRAQRPREGWIHAESEPVDRLLGSLRAAP